MEKRVISAEEFFGKALEVVAKEFAEGAKHADRIPAMFSVLSMAMDNLTTIWRKIAEERDDGLYEFTMDEFNAFSEEILKKVTDAVMSSAIDKEYGMLYSLKTPAASAIIRKVGKAIAGESDDSDD